MTLTTNTLASRVFLDPKSGPRSAEPMIEGGNHLRLEVPAGESFVLRVEADGHLPVTLPLKLVGGQELALQVALVEERASPSAKHKSAGSKRAPAQPTVAPARHGDDETIADPFDR